MAGTLPTGPAWRHLSPRPVCEYNNILPFLFILLKMCPVESFDEKHVDRMEMIALVY